MNKFTEHLFSYSLIAVWMVIYLFCRKFDLVSHLSNKGISIIGTEYYRYATSLLIHSKLLHVLFNGLAMFFVCRYLEPQISPWKLLGFSVVIGFLTEWIFSGIYRDAVSVVAYHICFNRSDYCYAGYEYGLSFISAGYMVWKLDLGLCSTCQSYAFL